MQNRDKIKKKLGTLNHWFTKQHLPKGKWEKKIKIIQTKLKDTDNLKGHTCAKHNFNINITFTHCKKGNTVFLVAVLLASVKMIAVFIIGSFVRIKKM